MDPPLNLHLRLPSQTSGMWTSPLQTMLEMSRFCARNAFSNLRKRRREAETRR